MVNDATASALPGRSGAKSPACPFTISRIASRRLRAEGYQRGEETRRELLGTADWRYFVLMRRGVARFAWAALLLSSTMACTACGSSALRAAEQGDYAKLKAEIATAHDRGKLSNGEAADLARAVAEREIATAKDEATALARLRELRGCSAELDDALGDRMKTHDGPGAEAAITLLDDGKLGDGTARDWLDDADDRWRAVGTRTLHRDQDRKRRQAAILDPSPKVRRSALRASSQAKDLSDVEALLETARVDPELTLRNEALRALGAVLRGAGDKGRERAADIAVRLRDLWTTGDDAIREDIAVAWRLTPVYEAGGREALRVTLANGKGPGAIAAAGVVVRNAPAKEGKDPAADELVASASALLARTIGDGSRRDRLHAIVVARLAGKELDALRLAARDDDREIKIPALARLLDSKADKDAAVRELEAIAGYGVKSYVGRADDDRMRDQASRARYALAAASDTRIQAWIEEDLRSEDARRKTAAAASLAAMGRSARAAPLLADPDPSVRTRTACTLLVAARR